MTAPRIEINLKKIRHNARHLVQRLSRRSVRVTGVTKAVCGHPEIAQAMLDGGVSELADARIENIERIRQSGIKCPMSLIRTPMQSQAGRVIKGCDTSFNTELDVIQMLSKSAQHMNTRHNVVLMVEMGDLREGIQPDDLKGFVRDVLITPNITLKGIGANFACLNSIVPDHKTMIELSNLINNLEAECDLLLEMVSGGNSANLPWAFNCKYVGRINNLRLGESILLGVDPITGARIDGLFTDAFTIFAEVIETKVKPERNCWRMDGSKSSAIHVVIDNSKAMQSILAIGYQDTDIEGLSLPINISFIGATSDHMILDTGAVSLAIGAEVKLRPNYSALMRAMSAPNIKKVVHNRRRLPKDNAALQLTPNLTLI